MSKQKNKPNVIGIIVFLVIFIGACYGIYRFTYEKREPVTIEQLSSVLFNSGYETNDFTEKSLERYPNARNTLNQCVGFDKDDIHFEFYDFNNEASALDIFQQAHSIIYRTKMKINSVEMRTHKAHFSTYILDSSDSYDVAIYVENTAIYAYCNKESAGKLNSILAEIGYIKVSNGADNNLLLWVAVIILLGLPFVLGVIGIVFRKGKKHGTSKVGN